MSLTTLVTFVEVFSVDINNNKSTKHLLQNAKREPSEDRQSANNTIVFNGRNYHYLPFIYQGTTINKSGDNIESNLILGNHPLSMAKAQEAVINKYFVEVNVCIMKNDDIDTLENGSQSILTTDTWLAASLSYDPEVVEVLLSSAIDSVGGNVPSLVLTTDVVGKLPVTSDIQNR
jgi:phage-related protein